MSGFVAGVAVGAAAGAVIAGYACWLAGWLAHLSGRVEEFGAPAARQGGESFEDINALHRRILAQCGSPPEEPAAAAGKPPACDPSCSASWACARQQERLAEAEAELDRLRGASAGWAAEMVRQGERAEAAEAEAREFVRLAYAVANAADDAAHAQAVHELAQQARGNGWIDVPEPVALQAVKQSESAVAEIVKHQRLEAHLRARLAAYARRMKAVRRAAIEYKAGQRFDGLASREEVRAALLRASAAEGERGRLEASCAELEAENARLESLLHADPAVTRLEFTPEGGTTVQLRHWAVRHLAASFSESLREEGGPNGAILEVAGAGGDGQPDGSRLEVVIRRLGPGAKSPADVLREERAENERLRGELAALRQPSGEGLPCQGQCPAGDATAEQ